MIVALAFALVAALGLVAGHWLAVRRLTPRVEAMHAAMTATRTADPDTRADRAALHLTAYRAACRGPAGFVRRGRAAA